MGGLSEPPLRRLRYCSLCDAHGLWDLTRSWRRRTSQAIDQVVNGAAKTFYMSGGQITCPVVFRGPNGPAAAVRESPAALISYGVGWRAIYA